MAGNQKQYTQKEIIDNRIETDRCFDANYSRQIATLVAKQVNPVWFRAELVGWDEMPERNNPDRPLILATNHSGMAFPWDAMVFGALFNPHANFGRDAVRPLTAPMLSQSNLMNPFTIPDIWKKSGGVDATFLNFETMMQQTDYNLLIYPEGIPGIGKGFNRKYQLQDIKTSFLRMSIKYKTDIIPFYTINAEYNNPYSYNSNFINKIVNIIGIPFLPLGFITPFILVQPWIFYFAFPANMKYVKGERIKPYEMVDKSYDELTQADFKDLAKRIRVLWQKGLTDAEQKYGKKSYDWKSFFKVIFKNGKLFFSGMPLFWVMLFYEFERLYKKNNGKPGDIKTGFFRNFVIMLKNPFVFFYFIPILGWIPIAIKGYRGHKLKNN